MTQPNKFWGGTADELASEDALAKIAPSILPCPFCGMAPTLLGSGERQRGLMIHCVTENCVNPSVSYYNHATAKAVWNRRRGADGVSEDGKS